MKKVIQWMGAGIVVLSLSAFSLLHISGEALQTGSPYDASTCGSCHTGTGTTSVAVFATPAFDTGNTYIPGTTYTVSAVVSGSFGFYGFDLEMLNSNSSVSAADAGTCGPAIGSNCKKVTFASAPTNYTHTSPSGSGNSATFSFQWTAPANGPVYIYCAGLGVNHDATDHGDKVATYSVMLSPVSGVESYEKKTVDVSVFPNPVRENISLKYGLPAAGLVRILLCDLKGVEIGEILRERRDVGVHREDLRLPAALAAGAYLLKISVDDRDCATKLIVY